MEARTAVAMQMPSHFQIAYDASFTRKLMVARYDKETNNSLNIKKIQCKGPR
jgi:hypothetical protein